MEDIRMFRCMIHTVNHAETSGIRFTYLTGRHSTNRWVNKVDLNQCKLNFFCEGHSYITINGKTYAVDPGDIIIYRPHDIHFGNIPYEQNIDYFQLDFGADALTGLYGGEELARLFFEESSQSLVQIRSSIHCQKQLGERFRALLSCLEGEGSLKDITALTLVLEILQDIHRGSTSSPPIMHVDLYPRSLTNALRFIHDNYQNPITTDEISRAVFVSRSYLNRLFQRHLYCSTHHYLLTFRLSHARIALGNGASVTEAAFLSGFSDSSSFAAAFKRIYHMTPSEFRQQNDRRYP